MTFYGLANCDTTKAAIKWLKQQNISYTFHDYKLKGITVAQIKNWLNNIPLEKLLNKKSTTWRGLSAEDQAAAITIEGAIDLMTRHTSLIKRPLIEWDNSQVTIGFDETLYAALK